MTINLDYEVHPSKQDLLDYVSETYGNNKSANRLKRIIFKNYSGKYIFMVIRNSKVIRKG